MGKITKLYSFPLCSILVCIVFLSSCNKQAEAVSVSDSDAKPLIVTNIGPYEFLLQELAGGMIEILNTSKDSADPHHVDISPRQVLQLKKAAMFLSINPLEENLILQSLGPETRIVEMWHGFPLIETKHEDEDEDEHEDEHEATLAENVVWWDEHFWTNPDALQIQITTMAKELIRLLPEQESAILAKQEELLLRCTTLAKDLRQSLPELENAKILVFHSSLSYFADFFHAEEISVEAGGLELGANDLLQLFQELPNLAYPVLIYAPQFEQSKSEALAKQLELELVEFNPQRADIFASLAELAADLAASRK